MMCCMNDFELSDDVSSQRLSYYD